MTEKREANAWSNTYGDLGSSKLPRLMQLPLAVLDPWESTDGQKQPFKMYSTDKLRELAENIRHNGIIEPIRARPLNGRFQILAGHNRCAAAKLAGLTAVPALVEDVDDVQARKLLVDSNLQHRDKLLPSELAASYKMRLDDMQGRQGQRTDLTSPQVAAKFRTDDEVAKDLGISADTLRRYIRLNYLLLPFQNMVDEGTMGLTVGVDLSFISQDGQTMILRIMEANHVKKLSGKQSRELRYTEPLTSDDVVAILGLGDKPPKAPSLQIKVDLSKFTHRTQKLIKSDKNLQDYLQEVLEQYARKLEKENAGELEL